MEAKDVREERVGPEGSRLPRGPRPDLCRRYVRKELAAALPGILRCFLAEAQKGSIPHMKVLTSLAGLDRDEGVPPLQARRGRRARSLSELLLRELRRPRTEAAVVEAPVRESTADSEPEVG